ncbi:MAG: sigma-70 family RNA polymerase sigma factor [Cyclobacteriaceae bacterium]|nr:sigma-70 family RNA polymerase sigma factor [Cyclobacteriaceae bacterium]
MNQDIENAFLEAIEQDRHKLLRICSVYAKDEDDKKDLFQEALINIWQSMSGFNGHASLSTWMYRITLNVCLRLQSKNAKMTDKFRNLDSISIENIRTDEKDNGEHAKLVQLRNCIKKLNDADKAVITLYLEELPYKDISEITGLSENNVAVKIKRVKEKLLNCIRGKS